MRRFINTLFTLLLVCVCFTGCNNLLSPGNKNGAKNELDSTKAYLKVKNFTERSIDAVQMQDNDIAKVELFADEICITQWISDQTSNAIYKMQNDDECSVSDGTYTFTLNVYSANGMIIGSATLKDKVVIPGIVNNLDFSLANTKEGVGIVSLGFNFSEPLITKVLAGIFTLDDITVPVAGFDFKELQITENLEGSEDFRVVFNETDVPAGKYFVVVKFLTDNDEELFNATDIVYVNPGLVSSNEIDVTDLAIQYTITYVLKEEGDEDPAEVVWREGYTPQTSFNDYQSIILPTAKDVSREGYEFAGCIICEMDPEGYMTYSYLPAGIVPMSVTIILKWQKAENGLYVDFHRSQREWVYIEGNNIDSVYYFEAPYGYYTYDWYIGNESVYSIGNTLYLDVSSYEDGAYSINLITTDVFGNHYSGYATLYKYTQATAESLFKVHVTTNAGSEQVTTTYCIPTPYFTESFFEDNNVDPKNVVGLAFDGVMYIEDYACYPYETPLYNLKSLSFSESLVSIGEGAFMEAGYIYKWNSVTEKYENIITELELEFPSTLSSIGEKAFYNAGFISAKFPARLSSIGEAAFVPPMNCVEQFIVDEGNAYYATQDGVLFDKDIATLLSYPTANTRTSYEIPSSVGTISYGAFQYADNLDSIVINGQIDSLGEYAFRGTNLISFNYNNYLPEAVPEGLFYDCKNLETVTFGDVSSLGKYIFKNNPKLYSVEFTGDVAPSFNNNWYDISGDREKLIEIKVPGTSKLIYKGFIPSEYAKYLESVTDYYVDLEMIPYLTEYGNPDVDNKRAYRNNEGDILTYHHRHYIDTSTFTYSDLKTIAEFLEVNGFTYTATQFKSVSFGNIEAFADLPNEQKLCDYLKGVQSVTLPETLVSIGRNTFRDFGVGALDFENKVKINEAAIEELVIPASVKEIGNDAFSNVGAKKVKFLGDPQMDESYVYSTFFPKYIENFDFASSCKKYTAKDGVWLSKNEKKLVLYPANNARTLYTLPDSVNSIVHYAFESTRNLTTVNASENGIIKSLGEKAFYQSGIKEFTFTENWGNYISVQCFSNCPNLKEVTIEPDIEIWDNAFEYTTALETFNIEGTLQNLGSYAFRYSVIPTVEFDSHWGNKISTGCFSNCSKLNNIKFYSNITSIGNNAFEKCSSLNTMTACETMNFVSLGERIFEEDAFETVDWESNFGSTIPRLCFHKNTKLKKLILHEEIESILDHAFYECSNLDTIDFDEDAIISTLASDSFSNTGFTSIYFDYHWPNKITDYCFSSCQKLKTITFSSKITEFTTMCFAYNRALESVEVDDDFVCTKIGSRLFCGCTALKEFCWDSQWPAVVCYEGFRDCTSLKTFTMGNHVTEVDYSAFYGCKALEQINLSTSVKTIRGSAFYNCSKMNTFTLPSTLTTIYASAFYGCTTWKDASITIPAAVESIYPQAFYGTEANLTFEENDKSKWRWVNQGDREFTHDYFSGSDWSTLKQYITGTTVNKTTYQDSLNNNENTYWKRLN